MSAPVPQHLEAVVIGGGPAGLMAAEVLAGQGIEVDLFDAMPSVGRKFLLAGKGGLNLTHAEPLARFLTRYGARQAALAGGIQGFGPQALRDWTQGLGVDTFVGTSQRVFPTDMKAAPLLRAWLHRLRGQGVRLHMRHRWLGFEESGGALRFATPEGERAWRPRATVLALGGASWPRLGSDGSWWPWLAARGVALAPLRASNCGFDVGWSARLHEFAGAPLKGVRLRFEDFDQLGEMVLTAGGVEGSLVYAASARLREAVDREGSATFTLDLLPARDADWVQRELAHGRGSRSLGSHIKSRLKLDGAKAALLWEGATAEQRQDLDALAARIKALPITVRATRPVDEAISTAGGVAFEGLDAQLMLKALPGVFCAGEMLDWEAPTGGYLLTACFSTGRTAGMGAARWLQTGQ